MKEATTSIFELALWKFKLGDVEDKANSNIRKKCRMDVQPGPVKDAILQFLPHECHTWIMSCQDLVTARLT